ncbi:MAG TPA: MFS transporter [Afipia sp.]
MNLNPSPQRNFVVPGRSQVSEPHLTRATITLFAIACGLSVASIYFAHPLLGVIAHDLNASPASIGLVVTAAQTGYALGLVFIVPLGDLVDRRKLIVSQTIFLSVALAAAGLASSLAVLLVSMTAMGLLAVAVQVIVAFAASLAHPQERGRVIGTVTGGVVIGILLARVVAGALSDMGGWRIVYLTAALLTLVIALLLMRTLPREDKKQTKTSYVQLVGSTFALFRVERILRIRAAFAFLIFASFNVFWTPMALILGEPPFSLSQTQIGLFGLVGMAGALGAGFAGRFADQGRGQVTTGLSLLLMLASWGFMSLIGSGLWAMVVGVVLLDLAIQAIHVTNQSLILPIKPDAQSRILGGYMVFYSIGSGAGSISSTLIYSYAGWSGVCWLGGSISIIALIIWLASRNAPASSVRSSVRRLQR